MEKDRKKDKSIHLRLAKGLKNLFKDRGKRDRRILFLTLAIIVVLILYILFLRGYFIKQEDRMDAEREAKIRKEKQERIEKIENSPKSRISFFLAKPLRANLAVPDYWEGNYRLSEKGNKTSFIYIENPSQTAELFHIRLIKIGNLDDLLKGEEEISSEHRKEKGGEVYTFVYKISDSDPYAGNEELKDKFDRMKTEAREMINMYFKSF